MLVLEEGAMPGRQQEGSAGEFEDIAALGDPDLRDRLSTMPLADQAELFRRSGWVDRVRIVKNSDVAGEVLASMPDEEVLLTFRGAGEDGGLALIPHCTDEQLRFILDVDLWNEHAVDEERVLKWLDYLVSSGEKAIIDFVRVCDYELVIVFLSKLIRLTPFEEAVETGEEATSIVPDDAFVVQALVPEETPAIRIFLMTIMGEDRDLYARLRYSTYRAIAAETEDEAYRWRNSRLEEKGILEYEEAARIYEALPQSEVRGLAARGTRPYYGGRDDIQVPAFYPLGLSGSRTPYHELLEALEEDGVKNRIAGDASYVTNRLLVADGRPIGDVDATREALDRLFSLASVGLLHLAAENKRKPAEVLPAVSISDLFRLGLGLVMDLGAEAEDVGKKCPAAPGFGEYALLEEYQVGVLRGLRRRVPQMYEPGATATDDYRDFRTPDEIAAARAVLARISVLAETCLGKLRLLRHSEAPRPASPPAAGGAPAAVEVRTMDFGTALMTGFARFVIDERFGVAPLGRREVQKFLDAAFVDSGKHGRTIDARAADKFLAWLKRRTGFEGDEWAILEAYVAEHLELVEADFAEVSSAKDTDSLLISSMLIAA